MQPSNQQSHIVTIQNEEHISAARTLFMAYTEWLNIDLTFQDFAAELQSLPGKYSPAHGGELLLAYSADGTKTPLGCVAVRPLQPDCSTHNQDVPQSQSGTQGSQRACCEMKRLYVSPEARGMGLGTALTDAIVQKAKELGYTEMRLDTLPFMAGAIQLYRRLGFVDIPPYYETPLEGTVFLSLDLT
ncbi:GNAT family N-acetyltransferase [Aspergillus affinis]|uniref:GNAT family N-acetyltransferase n=1 Tax=Aspergillus affinis TaxID=1070780 RepID=UPI0022FE2E93|nr:acyl-CoA N-acyltransferase [Aspergillus affinis]KAI9044010.1 acyl-CoA N-acyltransferase [Aspergillus affinis]